MAAEQTDIRGIAGVEIQSRFRARELRELGLELLPKSPHCRKAAASRWNPRRSPGQRVRDRFSQPRIVRETEVIVGAEIDALHHPEAPELGCRREGIEFRLQPAKEIANWRFGHFLARSMARRPRSRNSRSSSSRSGFGVVSSFSPTKMEFAPARKHSAAASRVRERRPALSRTIEAGISRRAVAIVRTSVSGSTGSASPSGVPATRTSMLMGTLSGCGSSVAS